MSKASLYFIHIVKERISKLIFINNNCIFKVEPIEFTPYGIVILFNAEQFLNASAVIAVCNVASSALAKEADYFINISAGAEIAVASTKAYNCQTLCLCALTTTVAHIKGVIDDNEFSALINELSALPELSRKALLTEQKIANFAKNNYLVKSVFFIGRGMDYYPFLRK